MTREQSLSLLKTAAIVALLLLNAATTLRLLAADRLTARCLVDFEHAVDGWKKALNGK